MASRNVRQQIKNKVILVLVDIEDSKMGVLKDNASITKDNI